MHYPHAKAIAHVATLAAGEPADPSGRVTLHFHPDRLAAGTPILRLMARDGVYRSQFETGTSNGGLTAHPGGDRWRWESRIFAGAYDDGPASFSEPEHFGVASRLSTLVALAEADDQDLLDDYIEAHLHGIVSLASDAEALVLDPCYRDTPVEAAARRLAVPVEWHGGFILTTDELRRHPGYRGQEFVDLGTSLARNGRLDPRILGDASRTGHYDEQALKRVWHYVARFGTRI
jgi:hypothetical protein